MTLAGIDVSAVGQGPNFPWPQWKNKIQFAGVKVSEAATFADPDAARNIAGARSIGATVIGYHFLHANLPGAAQAEWFLANAHQAGLKPGDLIAIDAEDGGLEGCTAEQMGITGLAFAAELQRHFPGYWPVVYTEISVAPHLEGLGDCALWLANPSRMAVKAVGPWKVISIEQTGQSGVDTDVFYGDAAALAKLAFR